MSGKIACKDCVYFKMVFCYHKECFREVTPTHFNPITGLTEPSRRVRYRDLDVLNRTGDCPYFKAAPEEECFFDALKGFFK